MMSGCGRSGISRERAFFIITLVLAYVALYYAMDRLTFEIRKDEIHFWSTSERFSEGLIPSLDLLRSYNERNTPLPFLAFGLLEYLFHAGVWAGPLRSRPFTKVHVPGTPNTSNLPVAGPRPTWPSRPSGARARQCRRGDAEASPSFPLDARLRTTTYSV